MEIIWSPRSLKKIEQIGDYISKDSPKDAARFVDLLITSVERLKKSPLSGQMTKENPVLRQIVIRKYRLIYRLRENFVEIITVVSPKEHPKLN